MRTLLLVDLQKDFTKGGSLAVKKGEEVIPVANRLIVSMNFDLIIATQDFHPLGHSSFKTENNPKEWPVHCVQGTKGAELHDDLLTGRLDLIIRKGMKREVDSYSAFYDNDGSSVGLGGYLRDRLTDPNVNPIYIMGLALDYCVKYTALDCVKLGFNTFLIEDGCRAVNICKGDDDKAIEEMKTAGIKIVKSDSLIKKE